MRKDTPEVRLNFTLRGELATQFLVAADRLGLTERQLTMKMLQRQLTQWGFKVDETNMWFTAG